MQTFSSWMWPLVLLAACCSSLPASGNELPNPYPRELVVGAALHQWDFGNGLDGWVARHHCQVSASGGHLKIRSTGADPYLAAPLDVPQGGYVIRMRMRSNSSGPGQFFWSSSKHPGTAAERVVTFPIEHDGQWHEYQVRMDTDGDLTALRLDPGNATGDIEVDWISVHHGGLHPLQITEIRQQAGQVVAIVRNHSDAAIDAKINGTIHAIGAGSEQRVLIPVADATSLAAQRIRIEAEQLPPIERVVWAYKADKPINAVTHQLGELTIQAAVDGSEVRLFRDETPVAALAPLVHVDYRIPKLQLPDPTWPLKYAGDGVTVQLESEGAGNLRISIDSETPLEGPVVRTFGSLEQGLLAGVEYLGKGESSSSKLDIETSEHLRLEPDPMQLTMPLMAFVTDRCSLAMLWDDSSLQPAFATPDFLDGTHGHRMSLKGQQITATVRVAEAWAEGGRLEDLILWAVKHRGLPELPEPPRAFDQQMRLSLKAYSGLIQDPENGGWFHAVVPGVRRSPQRGAYLADCASAIWRITGKPPLTPSLAHGGSHVRNSASYFVTGRGEQWLQTVNRLAEDLIRGQGPDGSYRYGGKFRRGHFEDTASGVCARPAYQLLEHAYFTGDQKSRAAGLKTLQYMKRFRAPRGAQTWEVPLHTPDILASAHAVWAYTRAFELTGNREHLEEARRWAITGLPFVYQWSNQPIMVYATTPVLGATNWQTPNWIGLPVQWCGTVYAYALLLLAPYENTLDWRQIAEGITICGEQMQYPNGPSMGTLPDVFDLPTQSRRPADINPGALVSLRLLLQRRLDGLAMATDGKHRVVSPYPVEIRDDHAVIQGQSGITYQILIDGARCLEIKSRGNDLVDLTSQ